MNKNAYKPSQKPNDRFRCIPVNMSMSVLMILASIHAAGAADLPANAAIGKVEVFQKGAAITRTSTLSIPSGQHRVVFSGLPAMIDTTLIRVTVNSKAVRLGNVDVEKVTQADFVAAKERELRAEIEKLEDAKAVLDDEIRTAEAQLKLLDSVSFGQPAESQKSAVDVQSLQGAVATVATSGAAARTRIREANIRKRDLDRSIAKLNQDLKKVATSQKDQTVVRAAIDASASVNAQVSVSYNVNDASWIWLYEAHLDTASKKVVLLKQAQVRQGSGEDWSDVDLSLTASLPSRNNSLAPLLPLYVRAESAGSHVRSRARADGSTAELETIVVTGSYIKGRRARAEAPEQELEDIGSYVEMEANTTEFAEAYAVPGKISIESNRQPRMFPVTDDDFSVELVARTIPRRESKAYLEAIFKYERNVPLQAAELQLFRDEAFIGKAASDTFMPGAEVRLPFGVDERIRVVVRQEQEQTGKRGVLGRQKLKDERLRFEVTNHHTYPIKVEVLDRIPVAKSSDVKVEVPVGGTAPSQKDFENKPGLLLWLLKIEPRQTATVKHYLEIRYPNDKELAGYEASE